MKYRSSFVSNSSSTSFTFVSKKDNLPDLIKKYDQYFNLYFTCYDNEEYHITADNVISAIEELKKKIEAQDAEESYKSTKIKYNIDEYIEMLEKQSKEYLQSLAQEKENFGNNSKQSHYKYFMDALMNELMQVSEKINKLKELNKKGFKIIYVIGFGDSHGEISGSGVGEVMDYEGRAININKPDFVVYTEQNR
jgi:hypothetical protein